VVPKQLLACNSKVVFELHHLAPVTRATVTRATGEAARKAKTARQPTTVTRAPPVGTGKHITAAVCGKPYTFSHQREDRLAKRKT
jgi:hypothetical protein